jgi:flagellar protein FlbD
MLKFFRKVPIMPYRISYYIPAVLDLHVIMLTRLNGLSMALNSDLVKLIEDSPDTVITLITGEKVVVRESTQEVISRIVTFRRAILSTGPLAASIPPHLSSIYTASELVKCSEDI